MGGRNFQYSSYHKEKLTWLGEQNIDVVSASKQVRLYPMETASEGVQSARVPRGNGDFIHLEYRQPIGFDSRLESGLTDGVLVRVGPDPNPSQRGNYARLFDMKPQTNAMTDAALAPGSTFQDGSIQIATVEATSDWALVNIVIDGVEPTPIDDGGASGSGVASTTGTTTSTGGMTTGTTGATSTTAAQTTGAGGNPAVTTSAGNTVTSVGGVGGTSSTGGVTGSTMTSAGASLTSTTSATTGFVGSTTGTGVTTAAATTGTSSGTTTGSATTTTGAVGGVTTTNPGAPAAPAPAEDSGCTCSTPGDAGSARGAGGLLGICLLLGLVRRRPSKHTSKQRFPSLNN
jgi:MYXO-CTERM domain-containing protein